MDTFNKEGSDIKELVMEAHDPGQKTDIKTDSLLKLVVKRFMRHKLALGGLCFVFIIVLTAIFAPFIAPFDPYEMMTDHPFMGEPTSKYLLGTDPLGRDVLSRLIYASRVSLLIGVGSTAISVTIGVTFGLISGYFGGWLDMIFMRMGDMLMSFPRMLLIMVMVSILSGGGLMTLITVMGFLGWPQVSRLVRGSVLSVKKMDYVRAGISMGFSSSRIIISHILPNVAAPIIVNATFSIARAMITEVSLSFLGMGVQPPTASWGNMLNNTQSLTVLLNTPSLWVYPGLMIMLTVMSFNFISDGLRDALDPNIKE